MQPKIIETPGLQWLVLPGEDEKRYTNFGDGRPGDASELVQMVNVDPALGLGHCDWRLPTKDELESHIWTEHAPKRGWFWSSSPVLGRPLNAWFVGLYDGYVGNHRRHDDNYVRLVRSFLNTAICADKENFMQPNIVETPGLQWLVLPEEGEKRYTNRSDFSEGDASELVARVNGDPALGLGHSDWRLPKVEELKTLVGTEHAPNLPFKPRECWYWSSSPYEYKSGCIWSFNFFYEVDYFALKGFINRVRLVRASQ